jgi:hypothetical protein
MDIYLWKDGAESGPYSEQDIREAVANGSIQSQQTARSSVGGDWLPLETLLSLGAEPIRSTPVRSRSITETESPSPLPEAESPYGLKSPMAWYLRAASLFAFMGVTAAGVLLFTDVLSIWQTIAVVASCLLTGILLQAMAEALDGLRVIAERLRRIEKKK